MQFWLRIARLCSIRKQLLFSLSDDDVLLYQCRKNKPRYRHNPRSMMLILSTWDQCVLTGRSALHLLRGNSIIKVVLSSYRMRLATCDPKACCLRRNYNLPGSRCGNRSCLCNVGASGTEEPSDCRCFFRPQLKQFFLASTAGHLDKGQPGARSLFRNSQSR